MAEVKTEMKIEVQTLGYSVDGVWKQSKST